MSSNYKDLSSNIVNQLWDLVVKPEWKINHDQHKEVLKSDIYNILLKNLPEVEFFSMNSKEIKEQIFHRNLLDIAQIMELSARNDFSQEIVTEFEIALNVIYGLISRDSADDAAVLKSKINDYSNYEQIVIPIKMFQEKARKINTLVSKMLSLIQHPENRLELDLKSSNPSFGLVFKKMASNPRFNEELSLYLRSLSN
jgi:hypothetical protein